MGLVAHVGGNEVGQIVPQQILPDDDNGHAGRSHVLLYAGPDQAVVGDVAGTGEEHGGLVRHQHLALGVGELVIGGAVDGLVLTDVDIVGVVRNVQIRAVRDIGEVLVGGGGNDLHLAVFLGLFQGLFGPVAGLHIAGHAVFHQVHGDHGKLHGAAALYKEHFIVVGDPHQLSQVGFRFIPDLLEHLGAMTHLHDTHPAAVVVHHLSGDLFQHFFRHHGRAGGKIIGPSVFHARFLHLSHRI